MFKPIFLVAAIAGFAAPALAEDEGIGEWVRSTPVSGHYSIETPCSAEMVELASAVPLQVGVQTLDQGTNVSCAMGEAAFASGVVSVSEDAIGDENLFEVTTSLLATRIVPDGVVISFLELDGHRALLSREVRGDQIAQTGIVELSNREMLMIISGGKQIGAMDMAAMIDRHVASLKVASQ